ncbi:MAG: DUF1697 domain-containing protein [Sphingobacterium sp.]|uniref:DUF1697 domain-containing protein n=1 Tax=Sphingobacterium sp. JB170 TaxID=1434842 RepID=UPI000B3624FB|nr:DUF1697 domain-containing protein [Sphingobacterium sp. JB170]
MTSNTTYVVLLRAVNVSGKNVIRMKDLREAILLAGYTNVCTYIQSGNIVLNAASTPIEVEKKIRQIIKETFGLEIKVFAKSNKDLKSILKDIPPRPPIEANRLFITVLDKTPSKELVTLLSEREFSPEWYFIKNKILYFYLPNGVSKAKLSNAFFERTLQVNATGRNLNTINALIQLSDNG